jgi:hypothetical protein
LRRETFAKKPSPRPAVSDKAPAPNFIQNYKKRSPFLLELNLKNAYSKALMAYYPSKINPFKPFLLSQSY